MTNCNHCTKHFVPTIDDYRIHGRDRIEKWIKESNIKTSGVDLHLTRKDAKLLREFVYTNYFVAGMSRKEITWAKRILRKLKRAGVK